MSNLDNAFRFVCQNLFIFYLSSFIVAVIFVPLYFIIFFAFDVCSTVDFYGDCEQSFTQLAIGSLALLCQIVAVWKSSTILISFGLMLDEANLKPPEILYAIYMIGLLGAFPFSIFWSIMALIYIS